MASLQVHGKNAGSPDCAEIIIVQSCGFIESAKQESINAVLSFRKKFPEKKIVLSGCLARRYEKELRESLTEADLIFGSDDISALVKLCGGTLSETETPSAAARPLLSLPGSAYIKIAEGCDNRCSFCAIPLIRGGLKSRSIAEIKTEFTALVRRGIKEINLIAQDTASFGFDTEKKSLLADLLKTLLETEGAFWIRLLYLHPDHFPSDILDVMKHDRRVLPYFDIPFQHASKRILSLMGRVGSGERYLELIERIREELPDAVIRSTFLTGFPSESAADFDELCRFQRNARLDWAGVFTYSREDGTPAYDMEKTPSKRKAALRKTVLETSQVPVTKNNLEKWTGRHLETLVEEKIDGGLYLGRTYIHAPEVDGVVSLETDRELTPGGFVNAVITGRAGFDFRAKALP
jgi:ribosomal protein S12 methylthiotransferase